jgi:hypothetical protein
MAGSAILSFLGVGPRLRILLERVAFNQKQKASKGAFERKREAVPFEFN